MGKTYSIEDILSELSDPDFTTPSEVKSFSGIDSITQSIATARKVFVCFYKDPDPTQYAKALHVTEARAYKGEEGRSQVIFQLTKGVVGVGRIAIRDHHGLLLYNFPPMPTYFGGGTEVTIDIAGLREDT